MEQWRLQPGVLETPLFSKIIINFVGKIRNFTSTYTNLGESFRQ